MSKYQQQIKESKLFEFIFSTIMYIGNHIIAKIPSYKIRHFYYKYFMKIKIGNNSGISMNCFIGSYRNRHPDIYIGDNSVINRRCHLDGRNSIVIGNNVNISDSTYILTLSHNHNDPKFSCIGGNVYIKNNAFIGVRSIILPNTTIGEGAVVGAGSIVTKNIKDYDVVVGSPAKKISTRNKHIDYKTHYFPFYDI